MTRQSGQNDGWCEGFRMPAKTEGAVHCEDRPSKAFTRAAVLNRSPARRHSLSSNRTLPARR